MNKRIISILLCVTMTMTLCTPFVSAAEDDVIFIDNTVISDGEIVASDASSA